MAPGSDSRVSKSTSVTGGKMCSTQEVRVQDGPSPGRSESRTVRVQDCQGPGRSESRTVRVQDCQGPGLSGSRTVRVQDGQGPGLSGSRTVLEKRHRFEGEDVFRSCDDDRK